MVGVSSISGADADAMVANPTKSPECKIEKDEELSRARTDVLSDEEPCPVGVATNRGGKTNQEDAYFVGGRVQVRLTLNGYSGPYEGCFGIFDGHGGDRASRFTAERVFDRIDESLSVSQSIEAAISDGVQRLDEEFCTIAKRTEQQWNAKPSSSSGSTHTPWKIGVEDGSTCLLAVIRDSVLFIGNVGDSRAVLATKDGKCVTLSIDQKPDRKDERDRIEAKGGFVTGPPTLAKLMWPMTRFMDVPRVNGALAMSRSIGDLSLKNVITSEPEIHTHQLTSDDRFLIMATDGLWDVVSSRAAAKMVAKCNEPQQAADALLKYALSRKTQDNITILVVDVAAYK